MQRLNRKIFLPSHYPKEGLDPIPVLGNLCREKLPMQHVWWGWELGKIERPVLCWPQPASPYSVHWSHINLHSVRARVSPANSPGLEALCAFIEKTVLVTCTWEIFPKHTEISGRPVSYWGFRKTQEQMIMINTQVWCKTIPWCMLMIHRLGIHSHWHQCKVVTVWIPVAENPVYIFMLTTSTTWSWNTSFGWWMFKEMLHNYHCVNWNELFYMFYDSPWYITLLTSCTVPSLCSPPILHYWNWPGYIIRYIWIVSEKLSTPVNSFFHAFGDAWHRYLRLLGLLDGKWVAFSVHLNMLPSQMWHRIIESLKLVNASKIIESNCNVSSVQKNASNKDAARERASPIPLWLYAEWEQWVNSGIRLSDYIWSNACNITMPYNAGPP